jgi:hypothetical protein
MDANALPLLAIFEKKMRLEVPLFQRQYVWNREHQWEPLWEDISRKFTEYLEGRKDAPVHFLGAMVLDQKQTPTGHVERRQIIDGQQRLTTLQIFLAAFRDFCRENKLEDLAQECAAVTANKGMMANPAVDIHKVWPTKLDQPQYCDVLTAGSRAELERRHPLKRKKFTKKYEARPRMVEAYVYFYDELRGFFIGSIEEPPFESDVPLSQRLDESFQALKNALQIVAIDLTEGDDAQVIFETLNARGEPLLPADLLRNYIFLRAARRGEPQDELYKDYWQKFDDPFWRVEVQQGRLKRPRSDLFMQHFLSSRQTVDVPIKHLFVEYKYWLEKNKPFASVKEELATLARQGDDFRRLIEPTKGDNLFALAMFLEVFDVRTIYPLLLSMLDVGVKDSEWKAISQILESYLLRRSFCGMTTKGYNRIFLALTRNLRRDGANASNLAIQLSQLSGDSAEWPSDSAFSEAWKTKHAYYVLNNPKLVYVLKRLNDSYLSTKMESLTYDGALSVEHLLPQNWLTNWPLADGQLGMTAAELWEADENDSRAAASRSRNAALHTIGNLTILTQALNSSVSNCSWQVKKPELLKNSLLPINQQLNDRSEWNESSISDRSAELLKRALALWPRP